MISDVEYIDDAFDIHFVEHFYEYFLSNSNWKYGAKSIKELHGARFFLSMTFDDYIIDDCPITIYIKSVAERAFDVKIGDYEDLYINGQTYELHGHNHVDQHIRDTDTQKFTLMYMPNFNNSDKLGGFEFMHSTIIDYKPGRLILFPSNLPHRGLAPTIKHDMRMTLVWKNCTILRQNDNVTQLNA